MEPVRRRTPHQIWIDAPLRLKGLVVVTIPVFFLLLATVLFYQAERRQSDADALVRHTLHVRDTFQRILTLMVDTETGVRGYLLTRDRHFLEPYVYAHYGHRDTLPGLFAEAETLVKNDPNEAKRLQHLSTIYRRQMQLHTRLLQTGTGTAQPPRELLSQSKQMMDTARQDLAVLRSAEDNLLQEHGKAANGIRSQQQAVVALCAILGIAGGTMATLLFTTGIANRAQQLQDNAGKLASESPLLPLGGGNDEIGHLGQALEQTSHLLAQRRKDLQASESHLQALFANTQDALILLDSEARFINVNPAAEQLVGYTAEELRERSLWDITAPADENVDSWRTFSDDGRMGGETVFKRKDGSLVYVDYHSVANILPGVHLTVARDITEIKQSLSSLRQAHEEAERANQAKSEFMSRVSHELRTPLNAILGFAQLMQMDDAAPGHRESLEQILKGGRHLLHLINEVLDIARVESGELSLSSEPVLVRDVAREAADLIQPLAAEKRINVNTSALDDCDIYAVADRQRLKQVFLNLLSNAVKFNRMDGQVAIYCQLGKNGELHFQVSDKGFGIPEDKLNRLFTPFDRLGAEKTGVEGTGLGLALCKGLIEAMGGTIDAQSIEGVGTTFTITLPTAENPVKRFEDDENAPAANEDALPSVKGRKVLYIEDNLPNLKVVEHILARHPETELISAMQGSLGLDLAFLHRPSLILLDLHLPDMSGSDVLSRLQTDPRTKDTPVVIVSADATEKQIERLLKAGALAYITKPLDVNRFLQILHDVMDKP